MEAGISVYSASKDRLVYKINTQAIQLSLLTTNDKVRRQPSHTTVFSLSTSQNILQITSLVIKCFQRFNSSIEFEKMHLDQKCGYTVDTDAISSIDEPYLCQKTLNITVGTAQMKKSPDTVDSAATQLVASSTKICFLQSLYCVNYERGLNNLKSYFGGMSKMSTL